MKTTLENQASYFYTCMKEGFSPAQQEVFDTWLNENDEHQKVFEKLRQLEHLYTSLPKTIQDEIVQNVYAEIKRDTFVRRNRYLAIAASLLIILCVGVIERYLAFFVPHRYSTEKIVQNVTLPDDSTVLFDVKTKAKIHYTAHKREVILHEGKAIFEVAKNPDKPFIVNAGVVKIEVFGTRFEVKNYNHHVDVSVLEGVVSVETDAKESIATLRKGKKLSFDTEQQTFTLKDVPLDTIASWQKGVLIFHDETLKNTLDEFKYYQGISISVQKEVENFSISGSFSMNEMDKFLYALTKVYALKVDKKADSLYISKK